MADHVDTFLSALRDSIRDDTLVKLTLGKYRGADASLRKVFVKFVTLAQGGRLSFVERHDNKDVTKNLPVDEGMALIRRLLGSDFLTANLLTTARDVELSYNKRHETRLRFSRPTHPSPASRAHNRRKNRPVAGAPYLALLGVTGSDGAVKKGMEAKYRQINRFIEIIDHLLRSSPLRKADALTVLDMGSGKGYLTFALYDYLTGTLGKRAAVTGIEVRPELVDLCNGVARDVGFTGLNFACGSIQDAQPRSADMLIALHACNTATDEALYQAIRAQAALVVCAPCCHKELRPQMACAIPGLAGVLNSGILLERQAELVTDGLRALLLEAYGYQAKIFEFIAAEHTSKNIMIAGIRTKWAPDRQTMLEQVAALKQAFGIESQALEMLLLPAGG